MAATALPAALLWEASGHTTPSDEIALVLVCGVTLSCLLDTVTRRGCGAVYDLSTTKTAADVERASIDAALDEIDDVYDSDAVKCYSQAIVCFFSNFWNGYLNPIKVNVLP